MQPIEHNRRGPRPGVIAACSLVLLCAIAAVYLRQKTSNDAAAPSQTPMIVSTPSRTSSHSPSSSAIDSSPQTQTGVPSPLAAPQVANSLPPPTPYSRQLVKALCRLDRSSVALTAEEAEQWKKNLDELVAQRADGAAGIA